MGIGPKMYDTQGHASRSTPADVMSSRSHASSVSALWIHEPHPESTAIATCVRVHEALSFGVLNRYHVVSVERTQLTFFQFSEYNLFSLQ